MTSDASFALAIGETLGSEPSMPSARQLLIDIRRAAVRAAPTVTRVPLAECEDWVMNDLGDILHSAGAFFHISGVRVHSSTGDQRHWDQPIIVQPEVGILGVIMCIRDGSLSVLLQGKLEPGNVGFAQWGPTVQATVSNYSRRHGGKKPEMVERFLGSSDARMLTDRLQTEQGARFLGKSNRNAILVLENTRDLEPLGERFVWADLSTVYRLVGLDNVVNMDLRSVLSSFNWAQLMSTAFESAPNVKWHDELAQRLVTSMLAREGLHTESTVLAWLSKCANDIRLDVDRTPLSLLQEWRSNEWGITHTSGRHFEVGTYSVRIDGREVSSWCQPLIIPKSEGLVAMVLRNINGLIHCLVQAKPEPGYERAPQVCPTVVCGLDSQTASPRFFDMVQEAPSPPLIDAEFSEEGGRFFRESNRYCVIEIPDSTIDVPQNFMWVTLGQLSSLVDRDMTVSVQGRSSLLQMMARAAVGQPTLRSGVDWTHET